MFNTPICYNFTEPGTGDVKTDSPDVVQLVEQAEAEDLANSILIEISAGAVKSWRERLQTRYGWFKSDNCKNLIFEVTFCQKTRFIRRIAYK